jgi:outer membrane autotransporter protein
MKSHRHTTCVATHATHTIRAASTTRSGLAALAVALVAAVTLALPASAADYYYNSFRNNNGNTEAAGNKYYTYYDGTYALYNSPGTWFFSDASFYNTTRTGATHGDSPIYVDANGIVGDAVFYGTNIYVHSERPAASSGQAVSVRNGATVYLFSSTLEKVNTDTGNSEGVYITDKSRFYGEDITITASAPAVTGISLANGAAGRLELNRATISTNGSAPGINLAGAGSTVIASTTITTTGSYAPGLQFNYNIAYLEYKGGSIHTTGANSHGIWAGINNSSVHYTVRANDIDILAENGAGLAINTNMNNIRSPNDTAFNDNNGIYEFSFENATIKGALGSVRVTSAATRRADTTTYEIPTRLILKLNNSTLINDIIALSRARIDLDARSTTLDGSLRAESASTINATFADSTITGVIAGNGSSTLDLAFDRTTIHRGVELSGSATAILRLANSSTLAGAITLNDNATLDARLDPSSSFSDNLFIDRGATFRLTISGGGSATLPGFTLLGRTQLDIAKTTITGPLILGSDAIITLANVTGGDLTLAAGVTGTGLLAIESIDLAVLNQTEIHVIDDQTRQMSPDAFTLAGNGIVDLGIAAYTLENRPDGTWLIGGPGSYGSAFGAIYNTRAATTIDFFNSLAPVHDHLADLRIRPGAPGGTLWATVHADSLRADAADLFPAFDQTSAGLIIGSDTHWETAPSSTLTTGFFADISRVDRDFTHNADGATTSYAAGLYAIWQHSAGWFAAAAARFDSQKHDFTATTMSANYRSNAIGASLELGHRFASPTRPWWFEPSVQAALVSLQSASYTTDSASPVAVHASGLRATRARVQARAGWSPPGGLLRFHGALAYAMDDTSGGDIRINSLSLISPIMSLSPMRRVLEGRHVEAALGGAYNLLRGSIRLDLATTLGNHDDYTLPWRLSLGYTRTW